MNDGSWFSLPCLCGLTLTDTAMRSSTGLCCRRNSPPGIEVIDPLIQVRAVCPLSWDQPVRDQQLLTNMRCYYISLQNIREEVHASNLLCVHTYAEGTCRPEVRTSAGARPHAGVASAKFWCAPSSGLLQFSLVTLVSTFYSNIISSLPNVKHPSTVRMQTKPHINATLDPHPMEMDDGPTACSCVLDHWPIHSSAASASLLNALSSIFNLVALRPILIARF